MSVGKILIITGIFLIAMGILIQFSIKLPGDIYIEHENFRFYFPLATSLLLSLIISLLLHLLYK